MCAYHKELLYIRCRQAGDKWHPREEIAWRHDASEVFILAISKFASLRDKWRWMQFFLFFILFLFASHMEDIDRPDSVFPQQKEHHVLAISG